VEILNSYKKKNDGKLITNKNKIFDLFELLKYLCFFFLLLFAVFAKYYID